MSAQTDIAADLTRIIGAKSDLKTSIEGKGVTVPSATKIDGYAALVDQIQQGGGGGHTGTVDTAGLQALGWDSDDIQWLQDHVWWDAEDDAEWAVTEANKAFGPNGATPLTWSNYTAQKYNPNLRYFPKLGTPTAPNMASLFNEFVFLCAIPTHGWSMTGKTGGRSFFNNCVSLRSFGDISNWDTSSLTDTAYFFSGCLALEEVDVSNWSFANITSTERWFHRDISLKTIKLPSSITAPKLTSMNSFLLYSGYAGALELSLTAPLLANAGVIAQNSAIKSLKVTIGGATVTGLTQLAEGATACEIIDLTGIDTTSVAQSGMGTAAYLSPFAGTKSARIIRLGQNFFKGSFTTVYMVTADSWSRDSIYESLYTNQTTRDSNSSAVTVKLSTYAYDRLSAQDISDIATKNITLTRG